jgi:hypothetical protein
MYTSFGTAKKQWVRLAERIKDHGFEFPEGVNPVPMQELSAIPDAPSLNVDQ